MASRSTSTSTYGDLLLKIHGNSLTHIPLTEVYISSNTAIVITKEEPSYANAEICFPTLTPVKLEGLGKHVDAQVTLTNFQMHKGQVSITLMGKLILGNGKEVNVTLCSRNNELTLSFHSFNTCVLTVKDLVDLEMLPWPAAHKDLKFLVANSRGQEETLSGTAVDARWYFEASKNVYMYRAMIARFYGDFRLNVPSKAEMQVTDVYLSYYEEMCHIRGTFENRLWMLFPEHIYIVSFATALQLVDEPVEYMLGIPLGYYYYRTTIHAVPSNWAKRRLLGAASNPFEVQDLQLVECDTSPGTFVFNNAMKITIRADNLGRSTLSYLETSKVKVARIPALEVQFCYYDGKVDIYLDITRILHERSPESFIYEALDVGVLFFRLENLLDFIGLPPTPSDYLTLNSDSFLVTNFSIDLNKPSLVAEGVLFPQTRPTFTPYEEIYDDISLEIYDGIPSREVYEEQHSRIPFEELMIPVSVTTPESSRWSIKLEFGILVTAHVSIAGMSTTTILEEDGIFLKQARTRWQPQALLIQQHQHLTDLTVSFL